MKKNLAGLSLIVILTVLATVLVQRYLPVRDWPIPQNLKSVLTEKDSELLGYTQYTSYLSASKEAMSGQIKDLKNLVLNIMHLSKHQKNKF
jgi:hypothetical protein